jgi:hypothetical protein
MYPFKPCRPSLASTPHTSVGLRRIVGTCQDPWSLAFFPLRSSLDPIIRPSRTYADSRLGDSHFCFCALPRSSFSTLVFLMEHWSPVSSVGSVNVVRYAAWWRSCNIVYIKLFVHNMIHFLLSSGLVPWEFKTSPKKWYSRPTWPSSWLCGKS